MTPRDFCFWLQGWFELIKTIDHREGASAATLKVIEEHLAKVFKAEAVVAPPFKIDLEKMKEQATGPAPFRQLDPFIYPHPHPQPPGPLTVTC